MIPRKRFLQLLAGLGGAMTSQRLLAKDPRTPLDKELVKEFVGKSHSDLTRVQEMLKQQPALLNCSYDWGNGDFESALEAAGHVGRKDIARFLLSQGVRMNIFCAAMLGELEIVRSTLLAYPELKHSKGPHGLSLRHHAKAGGESAAGVLAYLESINAS